MVLSLICRSRGLVAFTLAVCGCQLFAVSAQGKTSKPVTVMSYNIFQGSELSHTLRAKSFSQVPAAVAADYDNVIASNIPARARAIAAEIKTSKPDLVGLQEAVLWRTAPSGPSPFMVPGKATTVAYDSVGLLVKALARRGLHYKAVAITNNVDVQATGKFPNGRKMDVRFTDRVAVLARRSVRIANVQQHNFVARDNFNLVGVPIPVPDGWASVDAGVHGKRFRFVTTHLDGLTSSNSAKVRAAEAREIVDGPAHGKRRVIFTCDCNVKPNTRTHHELVGALLRDTWAKAHPGKAGLSCCHRTPPNNPEVSLTDPKRLQGIIERFDYVFARGPFKIQRVRRVGTKRAERTKTKPRLWPSDHFGVVAELRLS